MKVSITITRDYFWSDINYQLQTMDEGGAIELSSDDDSDVYEEFNFRNAVDFSSPTVVANLFHHLADTENQQRIERQELLETCLHSAAATNRHEFLREMLKQDLRNDGQSGWWDVDDVTQVFDACNYFRANKKNPGDWKTPLHVACRYGNDIECAKVLLEYHANARAKDKRNNTPLHMACTNSNTLVRRGLVQLLIEHGALLDINVLNKNNDTPLTLVTRYGFFDTKELLEKTFAKAQSEGLH